MMRPRVTEVRRVADPSASTTWEITERATNVPAGGRCLVFEGAGVARRVYPVPDDWRAMSDEALVALMYPQDRSD